MAPQIPLQCIPATMEEIHDLMDLQFAASEGDEFHEAIWGSNTTDNRLKAADRLLKNW
jgi:hypothetical protein